ncbi:hypothetical protein FYC62_14665 [Pedobacter aquae]|uniref:Uncharacterized protein n=1 Tax=Pedobacter aquae TaxID=2605747 RepID=A0A5C0VPC3_9SPHI|nr:hypothetical protein [Pedobacter aquae]QEK52764.1 hypothetical protein FYC62_14665 [Pedobacter aquae]
MLATIVLVLIVLLIISTFLFREKHVTYKYKTVGKTKKILLITALCVFIFVIISTLMSDGIRSFYCLSDDKCVTVWKRENGEVLLMSGKYKSKEIPLDNYIKITNMNYSSIVVLFVGDKLLVDVENNAMALQKSSNGLIALYRNNKALNDSLYTNFDGKYKRYKEKINYININIEENYATDKNDKKLN